MKALVRLLFGYGSPLVFTAFLSGVLFYDTFFVTGIPKYDLLIIVGVSVTYLWLQGIAAAWGPVGSDGGAMLDLILSMVPLAPLLLHVYDMKGESDWTTLGVTASIILYDVVVNTKIIFKIARLTSELAPAGR